MKIAVAGTGYVGLVTAVCLASAGHQVVCVDVDKDKIEMLRRGESPIFEPGLPELMNQYADHLDYTLNYRAAYREAEVIFIGVGTPEKKDGSANLDYVFGAARQIGENIGRDCVVVVKSTVPIGTNDKVEQQIREIVAGKYRVDVVSNPEFLAQGTAVRDTLHASRIVIGAENERAGNIVYSVYEPLGQNIVMTNRRSAEMIKYASNDFLALKISYINEIANLCELVGADISDVSLGMGLDSRIGKAFLKAGIGYGGSCFPKDTKALHWLANTHDYELKTIKAAIEVNENQKIRLLRKAQKYYDSFDGLTAAVLGLSFKPNTDDLREAPSLVNIPILLEDGAKVKAYDPVGEKKFRQLYPNEITYCRSLEEALKDADICFIFTEWDFVTGMDVKRFEQLMKRPVVIDGRNCFDRKQFIGTHVIYESIGRPAVNGK